MKKLMYELLDSKKYRRFHVIASKGSEQSYSGLAPLQPWGFTRFEVVSKLDKLTELSVFEISKKNVNNKFYDIKFNRDGSFSLLDKLNNRQYLKLHQFEDTGDRGDLYTFGNLGPMNFKTSNVRRKILTKGSLFSEIEQTLTIVTHRELNKKRNKRIGRVNIPVRTIFRFYRDIPRIDIETSITNKAKDHRIRVGFNLPYNSKETITSTHFGTVIRQAQPDLSEEYIEQPSGIQPQKRFIRIESDNASFTLINKGLPEVELTKDNRLSLTLLRSVGYLSRSDYPERPMQAGPSLETPGAQELGESYTFNYSFITHAKQDDITFSADHSAVYSLPTTSIIKTKISDEILHPIFTVDNPWIRVSSLRNIDDSVVITLYNLSTENVNCSLKLHHTISYCSSILIDGAVKKNYELNDNKVRTNFNPMEIIMIKLH